MLHNRLLGAGLVLLAAGCASQPAAPPAQRPPQSPPPAPRATVVAADAHRTAAGMSSRDRTAITAHHNKVRADVGVGPLAWSDDLAAQAQQWAEQLAGSGCAMKHRQPNAYGENQFQGTLGAYSAVDAAKAWESEKKDYRGGPINEATFAPTGHYTQMVWRQTTRLGCGEAVCRRTLIVACNYDPPGNVIGRRPY